METFCSQDWINLAYPRSLTFHFSFMRYLNKVFFYLLLIGFSAISCKTNHAQSALSANSITSNVIDAREYGAIPNDDKDDSPALQAAINDILAGGKSSVIKLEPGVYDIHKGLVIANRTRGSEYSFITMTLSGHTPAFSPDQRFGPLTTFRSHSPGFAVAVQLGRNCLIENIAFSGNTKIFNSVSEIFNADKSDWADGKAINISRHAPHCAIAIDPFHQEVGRGERYEGFDNYYTNQSAGGTSMVTIRGCSFYRFIIAIANNPSYGVSNGDNIRAEHCHVSNCHTFWACGQTQSRTNQVSNIYALSINTFIDGVTIGKQQGTPPFVQNVNIAGFCKYVFNVRSYFTSVAMSDSYMESIWSLGMAITNSVTLDRCHISFRVPDDELYSPPFHLYSTGPVVMTGCGLEYFANCTAKSPIVLKSKGVTMTGGWIEGGVVVAEGVTNEGGDDLQNIHFENVFLKCQGSMAGSNAYHQPPEKLSNRVVQYGDKLQAYDKSVFTFNGDTYKVISLGEYAVSIDERIKEARFATEQPGSLKPGDNIFCITTVQAEEDRPDVLIRPALGVVREVNGNQVVVDHVTHQLKSGKMRLYLVDYNYFNLPVWGDVQQGERVITNIITDDKSLFPKKGSRLLHPSFPNTAYITDVNPGARTIRMSMPALNTKKEQLIKPGTYTQEIQMEEWKPESVGAIIEGAVINVAKPFQNNYRFINRTKAIRNTNFKAELIPQQ